MDKLKIVHCANFSYFKNGEVFYATDRKITYGLMSQGHFVYDFSYRDQAKAQRFLGLKNKSIKLMNQDLIKTCENIQPDLLLLAKAEFIFPETLKKIKEIIPNIKIAKWFVDFLSRENELFYNQFKYIDCFFQTIVTGLIDLSKEFNNMKCCFLPNITDKAFDKKNLCEKEYDVIYIARDHKEDVRHKFAVMLNDFCKTNNLKLKLYASLGNPPIFGQNYYNEISKAKIAINFNRDDFLDKINENKLLGSSDRVNHFMGTGTCTFSPNIKGFNDWYRDKKEIVYFNNTEDCFNKILFYLKNDKYKEVTSNNDRVYEVSNSKKVTTYMLETIYNIPFSLNYEWKEYLFVNGQKHE